MTPKAATRQHCPDPDQLSFSKVVASCAFKPGVLLPVSTLEAKQEHAATTPTHTTGAPPLLSVLHGGTCKPQQWNWLLARPLVLREIL